LPLRATHASEKSFRGRADCSALINSAGGGIGFGMSFRSLFAMLFAVATIFAPLAMAEGQAMAAPVASHHQHAASADHCGGASHEQKPGKAIDHGCCTAMCLGIAVATASADELPAFAAVIARPTPDRFRRGFLGEIATPPPRLA
jgi:hypothetical protein